MPRRVHRDTAEPTRRRLHHRVHLTTEQPRRRADAVTGKALDYSQARPPLGKVKGNGYSCVYRYVCSDASEAGLPGKRLTPAERDQILAVGLDIGLHGEDNAGAAQGGYTRGRQQGEQWGDYAFNVLGAPKGMTI